MAHLQNLSFEDVNVLNIRIQVRLEDFVFHNLHAIFQLHRDAQVRVDEVVRQRPQHARGAVVDGVGGVLHACANALHIRARHAHANGDDVLRADDNHQLAGANDLIFVIRETFRGVMNRANYKNHVIIVDLNLGALAVSQCVLHRQLIQPVKLGDGVHLCRVGARQR